MKIDVHNSSGRPQDVEIYLEGIRLDHVVSIRWSVDMNNAPTIELALQGVDIDIHSDKRVESHFGQVFITA